MSESVSDEVIEYFDKEAREVEVGDLVEKFGEVRGRQYVPANRQVRLMFAGDTESGWTLFVFGEATILRVQKRAF